MDKREVNISIVKTGGNASKNSKAYRISLPTLWCKDMGIADEDRRMELYYDQEKKEILIKKKQTK